MGHQSGKPVRPRRGSLAFSPRVRAKRAYPRIKKWPIIEENKLLGFAAYKAGMSSVTFVDNHPTSPTKGEVISVPVTVLDVPKISIAAIKLYARNKRRQLNCIKEIWTDRLDKELKRKISIPKKKKSIEEELGKVNLENIEKITVLVYTLPKGRAQGKKKPDIFEIAVGGKEAQDKFEYAKSILGNTISVKDVLNPGEQVDIIAATKGKGFQGTVKRFGVKLQSKHTDRTRRGVASIGPDVPRKVSWRIPMPGQMGFHNRYDYNKWILKIGEDGKEATPKKGFSKYGLVKEEYILIKGSIPGASSRLIRMRLAVNPKRSIPKEAPKIISFRGQ